MKTVKVDRLIFHAALLTLKLSEGVLTEPIKTVDAEVLVTKLEGEGCCFNLVLQLLIQFWQHVH